MAFWQKENKTRAKTDEQAGALSLRALSVPFVMSQGAVLPEHCSTDCLKSGAGERGKSF